MKRIQQTLTVLFLLVSGCATQNEPVQLVEQDGVQGKQLGVQTSLSDGPGITALINKNYNEDTTSCTEYGNGAARGLYFCSGVLLRTTDNGNFPPWESSPLALDLRATSYAWIRHDLNTRILYKGAGFILLSPADVLATAVPGITYPTFPNHNPVVKCVYPFDAWTTRDGTDRHYLGCDYENTGVGSPIADRPWGSCNDKEGYTSASQYEAHLARNGYLHWKQCSWNADSSLSWRQMIASHNKLVNGNPLAYWNEVMLYNAGHTSSLPGTNELMRKWIVAFFYDVQRAGSKGVAQAFQQKMAATGKRVPILKLDFTAAPASRFQYIVADQVMYP